MRSIRWDPRGAKLQPTPMYCTVHGCRVHEFYAWTALSMPGLRPLLPNPPFPKIISTLLKKIHPEWTSQRLIQISFQPEAKSIIFSFYICLAYFMFFTLYDIQVLKIWRTVTSYVMWGWRFETVTFWNSNILWHSFVMWRLQFGTIMFETLMFRNYNNKWCYVKRCFPCVILRFVAVPRWAQMALTLLVAILGPQKVLIFRTQPLQWPE